MYKLSGLVLPGLFILCWILILSGVTPPGALATDCFSVTAMRWLLYFCGWAFSMSSIMHSVFAKKMATSIGWISNGFQYEIAAASLGLGIACFYAVYQNKAVWLATALPIITFLFFAAVNHVVEIIRNKNYAPNNTLILIWDFGVSISLTGLLLYIR